MRMIAEKNVIEISKNGIERLKTAYEVKPGETVEQLLNRMAIYGTANWNYDQCEVIIRLVKE